VRKKTGMHGAVPVEDGSVLHKTAKQLKNLHHCQSKYERMKSNNWQCKWKECSPDIPKELIPVSPPVLTSILSPEPIPKRMKTALETDTINEEDGLDATENDKTANQPDLYNLC